MRTASLQVTTQPIIVQVDHLRNPMSFRAERGIPLRLRKGVRGMLFRFLSAETLAKTSPSMSKGQSRALAESFNPPVFATNNRTKPQVVR